MPGVSSKGSALGTRGDNLLGTIEAIHAAGLDPAYWPRALDCITRAIGGRIASIESFDKLTLRHREFLAHGMPPLGQIDYLDHYAALNLRLPSHTAAKLNEIIYDYRILDEATMRRAPFYAEFLPRIDCRYFVSGIIAASEHEFAAVTVQRSARQGHIDRAGIALMQRLVPHVRQAFDVARRLKGASDTRDSFERTLDWLADGVAVVRGDGTVVYANESLQAIMRRNDGIRSKKGAIDFADAKARDRFTAAIADVLRLRAGEPDGAAAADFLAARPTGRRPYLISVRPLLERSGPRQPSQAAAIVFVRDPLARGAPAIATLRELFGFTEAEASLAQALLSGVTLVDYASKSMLSLNTVYTHLRRLREKTGCSRMAELIHRLNELRLPLRLD